MLIRWNFDIKKQKQTGCALIRACAIIMSNTVFTLSLKDEVPTMQGSWEKWEGRNGERGKEEERRGVQRRRERKGKGENGDGEGEKRKRPPVPPLIQRRTTSMHVTLYVRDVTNEYLRSSKIKRKPGS